MTTPASSPSSGSLVVRPIADDEIGAYTEIMTQSLSFPPLTEYDWISRVGKDTIRVIVRGGRVIGGAILLRFGQWFGGRNVPMIGISAVGVAADARGGGVGVALMRGVLEECQRERYPLSVLYPATQPVYRRPGYEQAGWRVQYRLPTIAAEGGTRELDVRPMQDDDLPAVYELYRRRAVRTNGHLERIPWNWTRLLNSRFGTTYKFVVTRGDAIEGYLTYLHKRDPVVTYRYDLDILDLEFATPAAGRRIISLFADHRSVCNHVSWYGAPTDPLCFLIPEQKPEIALRFNWMLRMVDVRAALRARGYAPNLRTELHFDVADDVLPHNQGRFVLEIAEGCGYTRGGGNGDLKIDVRGFSPLFTGFLTAEQLAVSGLLSGPADAQRAATAAFAGPQPWLADMF